MIGKTLGHYEIVEPLGKGGMGEVYRARDTNLDRDVAIKVLPEDFAEDTERLARFEREAKLLASLNHSNIATIHGLEESDGVRFISMELVDGDTLADRLAASGRIDVEEALEIARQIAEALEAAHESGVIHRDLKPANIKITPDEKVKVLDFGLAKAFEADGSPSEISPDLSHSPTMAAATRTGVILGTAAYMSPEQARGKPVDRRTDIWAFGCVLYEMLAGKQVFGGETVSDTMAAILKEEPEWTSLPSDTPTSVRRLLQRCLRKSAAERLRHIGDAGLEIAEAGDPSMTVGELSGALPERRRLVGAAIAVLVVGVALGATLVRSFGTAENREGSTPRHLSMDLRPNELGLPYSRDYEALALSPDGSTVVYRAWSEDKQLAQLHLRRLDERDARPISGTESGHTPFFSPDGAWIGYSAGGTLWRVPVTGGAPVKISESGTNYGAAWLPDGTIVLTPYNGAPLHGVSASGGELQQLAEFDTGAGEQAQETPSMLPDGRSVLFTSWKGGGSYSDSDVAVLSLETGEKRVLLKGGSHPVYAPTGHVVYARGDQLLAALFDLETLRISGTPVPVLDGLLSLGTVEQPIFAISPSGVLAYVRHDAWIEQQHLVWVDREGNVTPFEGPPLPKGAAHLNLSSDRRKLAFTSETPFDIWTYDLGEGALNKVTLDEGYDDWPFWADQDRRIVFTSARSGGNTLWWKSADGMGEAEELLPPDPAVARFGGSWSPDGVLAYWQRHPTNQWDIWLLPLQGERTPIPFATSSANEAGTQFSPDGNFLAYSSNESGRYEVYVEPVPQTDLKRRVSRNGGCCPLWSRDGAQLFFWVDADRQIWVAPVEYEPELEFGPPELFFERPERVDIWPFETSQGFLGTEREPAPRITQIEVVLNFFEELKRLVPTER